MIYERMKRLLGETGAFEPPKNVFGQPDYKLGVHKLKRVAKDITKAEAELADAKKAAYSIGVRIAEEDLVRLRAYQTFLKDWVAANKPKK